MHNKRILITGANGFIGRALIKALAKEGFDLRGTVRSNDALATMKHYASVNNIRPIDWYNLGDLTGTTDWTKALDGIDTIIHCAGRAHVLQETTANPLATFRQINCDVTEHLAKEAIRHKVRRIIFISTIGVLGNTSKNTPFTDSAMPDAQIPYTQSKLEAEHALMNLSSHIDIVIVRPPLVYGPGMKGNFKKLVTLVEKGLPLPLGGIKNKRQFLGIDNLINFIFCCIDSPQATNQIFLIADKEIITTSELLQRIAQLMQKKIILFPIPKAILKGILITLGKSKMVDQLLNNLEVIPMNAKSILNWEPPYTLLEQLANAVNHK